MGKKILVVGSGGREHALVWKLAQSPLVSEIFIASGNGGTALMDGVENVPISALDLHLLARFARERTIDLTVVGPEGPLGLAYAAARFIFFEGMHYRTDIGAKAFDPKYHLFL